MACTGRYAEAWQFAVYFCVEALLVGVDNSGGAGNLFLTDTQGGDFRTKGVEADVGMILYNTTQATSGPVTVVTATTITASGVTWDDGDGYLIATLTGQQRAAIEHNLNLAATDIYIALQAANACNCTFSIGGAAFLARLNCTIAAAWYSCTCGKPGMTAMENADDYRAWSNEQLRLLREGHYDPCAGATGAGWPAGGWAEQAATPFAQAQIIANAIARED
jgi:hypothetical protein